MNENDLQLVMRAALYASSCHRRQLRKDGCTPYIHHPLEVADLLARHGADVATVPFDVIGKVMNHPLTDSGLERFLADYKKAFG